MPYYHVELGYYTKRGGVALGITVKAVDAEDAEDLVCAKYLRPYPARKFGFCKVEDATPYHMSLGVANEPREKSNQPSAQ